MFWGVLAALNVSAGVVVSSQNDRLYDLETMMEEGTTVAGTRIEGFPGMVNKDLGTRYYPTLHAALLLLILAVVTGNVGMALSKRGK